MKKLDKTAHWEVRKGTHEQAKQYCTKELTRVEGPWEFGIDKQPGQRTDLEEIGQLIKSGRTPRSFGVTHPAQYMRYHRGMHALSLALSKPRNFKTKVTVIYGETGVWKISLEVFLLIVLGKS